MRSKEPWRKLCFPPAFPLVSTFAYSLILKKEATFFSETAVFYNHRCVNLILYMIYVVSSRVLVQLETKH
jgi:hypothetical protein